MQKLGEKGEYRLFCVKERERKKKYKPNEINKIA